MTPYETAAALAYLTTSSPPDAQLMALADTGALTSAELKTQFNRLIATPAGHGRVQQFITEWLGADTVADVGTAAGPVTPAIAAGMLSESQAFVDYAVFTGTGTLNELLTGSYTFADANLAAYYGLTPATGATGFSRITDTRGERAGLLTQGSFLATTGTAPVQILRRGLTLRNKVLCEQLPSFASLGLPGFTPPALAPPGPGQTTRQALEAAVPPGSGTPCANCHQFFQPLGDAFEQFDKYGQYRTTDNGVPVDVSGFVAESDSIDPGTGLILDAMHTTHTAFSGFGGLGQLLSQTPEVNDCFAKKVWVFSSGRADVGLNECAVGTLQQQFTASGGQVLPALAQYVQSDPFVQRKR